MPLKSKTIAKELELALSPSSRRILHAHLARLAVLYEDLRIEITGVVEASIPALDTTDEKYHRNYFLRRSIATVIEFAETFRLLSECDDFALVKKGFDKTALHRWQRATKFFKEKEPYLKKVRNDIGGHFGTNAALHALDEVGSSAVGMIEAFLVGDKEADIRFKFAGELAAAAMLRNKKRKTSVANFGHLIKLVRASHRYAVSPPYTFFLLNGDMELYRNRHFFI
jgi:hypothetical protein